MMWSRGSQDQQKNREQMWNLFWDLCSAVVQKMKQMKQLENVNSNSQSTWIREKLLT